MRLPMQVAIIDVIDDLFHHRTELLHYITTRTARYQRTLEICVPSPADAAVGGVLS